MHFHQVLTETIIKYKIFEMARLADICIVILEMDSFLDILFLSYVEANELCLYE